MTHERQRGIKILAETEGAGAPVAKVDKVTVRLNGWLNRVPWCSKIMLPRSWSCHQMTGKAQNILVQLASEAIRLGADALDIEYKGGYKEVFAMKGPAGFGIASFRSSSQEAVSLRQELYTIAKKALHVTIGDCEYKLKARIYDSFGEDAFHVELRRAPRRAPSIGRRRS